MTVGAHWTTLIRQNLTNKMRFLKNFHRDSTIASIAIVLDSRFCPLPREYAGSWRRLLAHLIDRDSIVYVELCRPIVRLIAATTFDPIARYTAYPPRSQEGVWAPRQ